MLEYLEKLRHSASHVLAHAVTELFPGTKLGIGPAIEDGFYYDFECPETLNEELFSRIQDKMQEIIDRNLSFVRKEMTRGEALDILTKSGEKYKIELLEKLVDTETVSFYQHDGFMDLCKGPHVESTGEIKVFKLLRVAGAYWRGDENNPMLQRIYGTAYENQQDLDDYLTKLEEAAKRDHRKLCRELDFFSFPENLGPGLLVWHPKGSITREVMEEFWKKEHKRRGYQLIYTPHIAKKELFEKSGHYDYYKDFMFTIKIDNNEYVLKPMNCPMQILIYKSRIHSYRELPIRYAELGTVYRNEKSGVLHGGLRVRGFTMDDGHIFCSRDQIEDEIAGVVELAQFFMETFGFKDVKTELSLMDKNNTEKYAGALESWEISENSLRNVLTRMGIDFEEIPGEAAFYGPKIDFKIIDSLGRSWQLTTVQFDFNLPERFDINYVGQDGMNHRIYLIHRAILGGLERFTSILLEHYGGSLPLWLSPEQVRILPIADRHLDYAKEVEGLFINSGVRVHIDSRREKLSMKIRESEVEKVPYSFIVGDKEAEGRTVSVRRHKHGDLGSQPIESILKEIIDNIAAKVI